MVPNALATLALGLAAPEAALAWPQEAGPYVYVANSYASPGNVSVIDARTNKNLGAPISLSTRASGATPGW